MASLDVISLYTRISHDLAIKSVIEVCLDSKIEFPISMSALEELISFCFSNNCFVFNGAFHRQHKRTPMRSSLNVRVAEVVMQKTERKISSYLSEKNLILATLRR